MDTATVEGKLDSKVAVETWTEGSRLPSSVVSKMEESRYSEDAPNNSVSAEARLKDIDVGSGSSDIDNIGYIELLMDRAWRLDTSVCTGRNVSGGARTRELREEVVSKPGSDQVIPSDIAGSCVKDSWSEGEVGYPRVP